MSSGGNVCVCAHVNVLATCGWCDVEKTSKNARGIELRRRIKEKQLGSKGAWLVDIRPASWNTL